MITCKTINHFWKKNWLIIYSTCIGEIERKKLYWLSLSFFYNSLLLNYIYQNGRKKNHHCLCLSPIRFRRWWFWQFCHDFGSEQWTLYACHSKSLERSCPVRMSYTSPFPLNTFRRDLQRHFLTCTDKVHVKKYNGGGWGEDEGKYNKISATLNETCGFTFRCIGLSVSWRWKYLWYIPGKGWLWTTLQSLCPWACPCAWCKPPDVLLRQMDRLPLGSLCFGRRLSVKDVSPLS